MLALSAFLIGLVFAFGLIISGMTNPAKVQAFLDLAGPWDPSLALVMVGAIAVAFAGFHRGKTMQTSWLKALMQLPARGRIDIRLVAGSALFGAGWGLAGFCPGPALVSLGAGESKAIIFVLAMLAGMAIHWLIERKRTA